MISRRKFLLGGLVSATGLMISDSFYFEKYFVETREYEIGTKKKGAEKIKMLQITDLHITGLRWYHKELARKVNALKPDLILFTGDMFERKEHLVYLNKILKLIDPDIQKFAVNGNWEYASKADIGQLSDIYKNNNCDLLVNESRSVQLRGKRLMITGFDDMLEGGPDFSIATENLEREKNHIALAHCPAYRDNIEIEARKLNRERSDHKQLDIDYVFSGHTHGGQVTLLGYAPILPPGINGYLKGWYEKRLPRLYVSKGVGTSVLPVRFGARAEITLFHYYLA